MTAPQPSVRRRVSQRVRAALAGGLVFGLGAGLTVAAWTESEYVTSTFTAGEMRLQLDVGAGYQQTSTVSAAVAGVFPGSTGTVYQPVRIQTTSTSVAGAVTMSHAAFTGSGITSGLRYRVIRAATCNAAAFASAVAGDYVIGTSTLTTAPLVTTAATNVAIGAAAAKSTSTLSLCFEYSLLAAASATYMGTTSTPAMTWTFTGTSS